MDFNSFLIRVVNIVVINAGIQFGLEYVVQLKALSLSCLSSLIPCSWCMTLYVSLYTLLEHVDLEPLIINSSIYPKYFLITSLATSRSARNINAATYDQPKKHSDGNIRILENYTVLMENYEFLVSFHVPTLFCPKFGSLIFN